MGVMYKTKEAGQMTVELAVVFPVLIIIAVIAVNALLFFSECAAFDNLFRDSVRLYAASPAYEQGYEQSRALIEADLTNSFNSSFESLDVVVEGVSGGYMRFTATLNFYPTLFGRGAVTSVFGVSLPSLSHSVSLVVDCYKPGVVI